MCIRDVWLIDISPLAKASASYKHTLDVEYFMRRTFFPPQPHISVGKVRSRCSASGVPYQYYSTYILNSNGEGDFLHPLKLDGFRRKIL